MQQNFSNLYPQCYYPQMNPNAVNINIVAPQAYGAPNSCAQTPINNNGFYSLYGQNTNPNLPLYPQNYNNLALQQNYYPNNQGYAQNPYAQNPIQNQQMQQYPQYQQVQAHQGLLPDEYSKENYKKSDSLTPDSMNQAGMANSSNLIDKTTNTQTIQNQENVNNQNTQQKTKKVTPLTDDYVKSIENYMNNENPKIRLIGTKELLERFKEDENRKDNPSLMPLLNKALKDTSPSVRFLALTILQLGYAVGNDETVGILKEIQTQNKDKIGEDALLASEILLNMSAAQKVEVPMTQNEIEKENSKKQGK